jgi:hypothetical protein
MDLCDIGFLTFCVIIICLFFIGISRNLLTKYGVGLLIGILVLGIVGYNIWANFQVRELMQRIDLTPSHTEKRKISVRINEAYWNSVVKQIGITVLDKTTFYEGKEWE